MTSNVNISVDEWAVKFANSIGGLALLATAQSTNYMVSIQCVEKSCGQSHRKAGGSSCSLHCYRDEVNKMYIKKKLKTIILILKKKV